MTDRPYEGVDGGALALIDPHAYHVGRAVNHFVRNEFEQALAEIDHALFFRDSAHARWDRALTLLALGRYSESVEHLGARFQIFGRLLTTRGKEIAASLPQWDGESGRRVMLVHESGFGDSIMLMRFVPRVKAISESVVLIMPPALERFAQQFAPLDGDGDCWAGMFDLIRLWLPIPQPPYLKVDEKLRAQWRERISHDRPKIGIAWSSASAQDGEHDFQRRGCELGRFLALLNAVDCDVYCLQAHGHNEAVAHGVKVFEFADFADVGALAAEMETIVAIDTAALHVAGAIGHPNVNAILPYAATWRWLNGNRWYPTMNLCKQTAPGHWASAFAKVKL